MAIEFKKSLDTFKVPAAEQKELLDIVGDESRHRHQEVGKPA